MASYDPAFDKVLGLEGGYVDHPNDPGGATNWGISIRYLRERGDLDGDGLPDGDLDGDGDIDVDDIRAMNPADAKHLYHTGFWVPNRLQEIADQEVAEKIFDMCVNMGSRQAWKLVQQACNEMGGDLTVDGIVGPATLGVIDAYSDPGAPDGPLVNLIREQQVQFYERLVERRPNLAVFLDGWKNRAMA